MAEHVTYWAVSVFSSRTFWLNAVMLLVGVLSATEVLTIIPPRLQPMASALVAVLNIILRIATVRPVAFIAPGETQQVLVNKIDPPPPASVTD